MKIDSQFAIPCPTCGGSEYKYPEPLKDDSFVECTKCGLSLQLSDLREHGLGKAKEHLVKQAQEEVQKMFKKFMK